MKKRTPQEKKKLSLERDRRNAYGESPHNARKNIPLRKALANRATRHQVNQQLGYEGVGLDDELADDIESRVKHKAPQAWIKYPDKPLGEVVARKLQTRAARQKVAARKVKQT